MASILVINGPNMNLLGLREPEFYGSSTLPELESHIKEIAHANGHTVTCMQSNSEHVLIEAIHGAMENETDFIIINAGGYAHTSIALRDAFLATEIPFVEVHMSNVFEREEYRQRSYLSDIAQGVICGFGTVSYMLAVMAVTSLAHAFSEADDEDETC
ncbi:MAG: type II 3-dehydroquinate dehydratase [Pseudomonadota bacterium]